MTKDNPLADYPSYGDLIEFTGLSIVNSEVFGSYQGDEVYLVSDGHRRGVAIVGYGSCSGCDALEATSAIADREELAWEIRRSVHWGDRAELLDYLTGDRAGLQWYGHEFDWTSAVDSLFQDAA